MSHAIDRCFQRYGVTLEAQCCLIAANPVLC